MSWSTRITPGRQRLATLSGLACVLAVALRAPQMLALATPLLVVLFAQRSNAAVTAAVVTRSLDRDVVAVGESAELVVDAIAPRSGHLHLLAPDSAGASVHVADPVTARAGEPVRLHLTVRPDTWGRHVIGPLRLELHEHAGGRTWCTEVPAVPVFVPPQSVGVEVNLLPPHLRQRLGEHVAGRTGGGAEYLTTAEAPGAVLARRVNWRATARTSVVHVDETAAELSTDVVLLVDQLVVVPQPGGTTASAGAHAALSVAAARLRAGDRVSLATIGETVRWAPPGLGVSSVRRLARVALEENACRDPEHVPAARLPHGVPPPGAVAVVFSPLLHPRIEDHIAVLAARGHRVTVVDVLTSEPVASEPVRGQDELALRLWRLKRHAKATAWRERGVQVVAWSGGGQPVLIPRAR